MKSQSHDILAKLLATENVNVIRDNVSTASFDIANRILRLPIWKDITPEIEEMLILHEVGHALYTTVDGYGVVHTPEKRHLKGYANIIEDVRIEKKMKDRYPGSRKSFNAGYTQLNERDFFEVEGKDLHEYHLIDRINIFYKVGYNSNVKFTSEEYEFVQRADKCSTEADVLQLAEDIYNFSKEKKIEEQEEKKKYVLGGAGDSDEIPPDVDIEPETIDAFDKSLSSLQDRDSRTEYIDAQFEHEHDNVIIPHKTVIKELQIKYDADGMLRIRRRAKKFKTESSFIINYLVKEFEMRKSASAYKRTKISKIGQIDSRKLFAYQLKDDIFKQIATVQEGKKHGMIFLLDWSGSMTHYMRETVEQVINLVLFCQKIDIPYQVFAFTDGYARSVSDSPLKSINPEGIDSSAHFSLLELFNHRMNSRDMNSMIEILLDTPWSRSYNSKYGLHGTPLNQALIYMIDHIGNFVRANDIEKMNLITLTDGESNCLSRMNAGRIKSGCERIYVDGSYRNITTTTILRDKVTKKEYAISDDSAHQTEVLLNLLKDRHNLRSIGFYITNTKLSNLERLAKVVLRVETSPMRTETAVKIHEAMRKDKGAVLKNVVGRDQMYIIPSDMRITDDELDDVTQDMSASQISRQLGKMFNSRKSSRVVLNNFIGVVA